MKTELLCTIGPSSRKPGIVERLEDLGATLLRINLSHTSLDELPELIGELRSRSSLPVCLDTEGAQVRTGDFIESPVELSDNTVVTIHEELDRGIAEAFNLYPRGVTDRLEVGDFLSIDSNGVLVEVVHRAPRVATLRVVNGGAIGQNKAVTVMRNLALPALTEKDRGALEIGAREGIDHVALSFAHRPEDVDEVRGYFDHPIQLISKIECISGLNHLDAIIEKSDAILIDRGDLSREVPIERIPIVQRRIVERTKSLKRRAYVATNLLESMILMPQPTRAEVNDVYNTLRDGADGLVLAAETAIGKYPIGCAQMVNRLVREFESAEEQRELTHEARAPMSLLVAPHGGDLVHRMASEDERREISDLPKLKVHSTDLMDCEQIATGTYSPLTGFMDQETLQSVLDRNRLPDGTAWTLPIVLQASEREASRLSAGQRVVLTNDSGELYAILDVTDIYSVDLDGVTQKWFGTTDRLHPGVARLRERGDRFVGGRVTLIRRIPSLHRHYELTPAQTRLVFSHKGWSRVVGFHTRNVCHRVHEYIQQEALRQTHADGLFISPVIGPKKSGDFLPEPLLRSYEILLADGSTYPPGKVVLGSFATYSRYAGPREAVFTAICRQNMGCSHFILGRDHTGVGEFYGPDENRRLFEELGDISVRPFFFEDIGYCERQDRFGPLSEDGMLPISGTRVRDALRTGEELPGWMIRPQVVNMLRDKLASGQGVFVT